MPARQARFDQFSCSVVMDSSVGLVRDLLPFRVGRPNCVLGVAVRFCRGPRIKAKTSVEKDGSSDDVTGRRRMVHKLPTGVLLGLGWP